MREQKGYVFHKGKSWFVRYCDDVMQPDGAIKRKLVCKKLDVPYGGQYRTRKSVQPFVEDILAPVNRGLLNPQSTMLVSEFVERVYLPEYVTKELRVPTHKQYRYVWNSYLKPRMDRAKLALRDFRTLHAQQMLANIAEKDGIGRSSLKHCKAFLSGAFKQAKRLGILDGVNPIQDTSIPRVPEPEEDTYAHSLEEINAMLTVLPEPAWTVVQTAALTGFRKSELRGLRWEDFDGETLTVRHSVWNSVTNEPKTKKSRAPIPVVKRLADALEAHRLRCGILAQPGLPIFQGATGKPLNLDNLAGRVIAPALSRCAVCKKREREHKPEAHLFQRDESLPRWHGWHAFRRGLATNLHEIGTPDKEIQAILRHSNISITMNTYVKSVSKSQVSAMDALEAELKKSETCNDLATSGNGKPN